MTTNLQTDTTTEKPEVGGTCRRRWLRRIGFCAALLCATLLAAYVFRAPLLRGAANLWIVNEPLEKADVIVVLGGGQETRPFEAARLYHQGLASTILIMDSRADPTTALGLTPAQTAVTRQVLIKQNVPESAIMVAGSGVANTYDESVAVREWVKANGIKKVIIPTDPFHTRRVCWLFHKQLRGEEVRVIVEVAPVRDYTAADWWRHENGMLAFQTEIVKYVYYRVKY